VSEGERLREEGEGRAMERKVERDTNAERRKTAKGE
jgi:hypothetical protein